MRKTSLFVLLASILLFGCQSDDNGGPETTVTSFSGNIEFENGVPVTNAELSIGSRIARTFGSVAGEAAFIQIYDGTFEVLFETEENVTRYSIVIDIINVDSERVAFDDSVGLQCLPGNCRDFPPGQNHELTIIVPCIPDNCVQLSPLD